MKVVNLFNHENKDKIDLPTSNKSTIGKPEEVDSMEQYGKKESVSCMAEHEMYLIHLKRIESGHIVKKSRISDQQQDEVEEQNNKIKNIESKTSDLKDKISNIENVLTARIKKDINSVKANINEHIKKDPKDIPNSGEKFKPWMFSLLLIFTIFLTFSLYYFYVNLGYVIFDLPTIMPPETMFTCSPSVLNSIHQLIGNGGCHQSSSTGSLLLPILFLSIATIIHRKSESLLVNKKVGGYLIVLGFVAIVLLLDIILAIKFEAKLFGWNDSGGPFGAQFPIGIINQLKYSIDKPAFILILGLGFMSYIVWSFLIHELTIELDKRDPELIWRSQLKKMENNIESLNKDIKELIIEQEQILPNKIRELNKQIEDIKLKLKLIKIGGKEELKKGIIEFTIGWIGFITFNFEKEESEQKTRIVKDSLEQFLRTSNLGLEIKPNELNSLSI